VQRPVVSEQVEEVKQATVDLFQINPFVDPEFLAFKALVNIPKRKEAKEEEKKGKKKEEIESMVHEIREHDMVALVDVK
jgi:hypothetical protein